MLLLHMKVRVYFCREIDPEIILKGNKISRQALDTIYDLVWECEFKNILNVGRLWLKFREEKPFGIPVKEKRSHSRIAAGDIIQIGNDFYMVNQVGARQLEVTMRRFAKRSTNSSRSMSIPSYSRCLMLLE